MIYIKKPLIFSGSFNAAKPTHQKSNVWTSLSADLQRHVLVCCVPGVVVHTSAYVAKIGMPLQLPIVV
ncbi:Uncharacterised protein [Campylobacter jejuni]|nr:Uncharacterised protein [Campylobacter jejuni]